MANEAQIDINSQKEFTFIATTDKGKEVFNIPSDRLYKMIRLLVTPSFEEDFNSVDLKRNLSVQ